MELKLSNVLNNFGEFFDRTKNLQLNQEMKIKLITFKNEIVNASLGNLYFNASDNDKLSKNILTFLLKNIRIFNTNVFDYTPDEFSKIMLKLNTDYSNIYSFLLATYDLQPLDSVDELVIEIKNLISNIIPEDCYVDVFKYQAPIGKDTMVAIKFASTDYDINGVRGQKPEIVSLSLNTNKWELQIQGYGGNGGQSIYVLPDKTKPEEKHLALKSVKIPFRKPSANKDAVLKTIEKFAKTWCNTINQYYDRLKYFEYVDYSKFENYTYKL